MKNEKTLEQKLDEAEEKMPGMKKLLQNSQSNYGWSASNNYVTDVEYLRAFRHQVVAVKRMIHTWRGIQSGNDGGIEWVSYSKLYYIKDGETEIKAVAGPMVKTRDAFNPEEDRPEFFGFNYIQLRWPGYDEIRFSWTNDIYDTICEQTFRLPNYFSKEEKDVAADNATIQGA